MDDAATFRREAGRYRKLAEEEPNPEVAQRMRISRVIITPLLNS